MLKKRGKLLLSLCLSLGLVCSCTTSVNMKLQIEKDEEKVKEYIKGADVNHQFFANPNSVFFTYTVENVSEDYTLEVTYHHGELTQSFQSIKFQEGEQLSTLGYSFTRDEETKHLIVNEFHKGVSDRSFANDHTELPVSDPATWTTTYQDTLTIDGKETIYYLGIISLSGKTYKVEQLKDEITNAIDEGEEIIVISIKKKLN